MRTRRSTPTAERRAALLLAVATVALVLGTMAGCDRASDPEVEAHRALPLLETVLTPIEGGAHLYPLRLQTRADSLYVCYRGVARLDVYGPDMMRARTIPLTDPEPVKPTAFVVLDSSIVVCDHARGMMIVYGPGGAYRNSFGLLPDGESKLAPLSLDTHSGMAYLADMGQRRVLAVSLNRLPNVVDEGELVLRIPPESSGPLGLPTAVHVTPDGRLLVGDAGSGEVRVFTCDGRSIYRFDPVPGVPGIAAQGFAMDDLRDPGLSRTGSFDPSGIRGHGRIHVADGRNGRVHVFNTLGTHAVSYPEGDRLEGPSDVAIDRDRDLIFVADPPSGRILVYSYQEG